MTEADLAPVLRGTFDAVRIINLPHRADRRAEVAHELDQLGLELNQAPVSIFDAIRPEHPDGFDSIGARGCFMSHIGVLREALAANTRSLLILEDDVAFGREARARLPALLHSLESTPWSIFYGSSQSRFEGQNGLVELDKSEPVQTTHCLAVRHDVLAPLIAYLEAMLERPAGSPQGGPMHVDGAYSWFRRAHPQFRTFAAVPAIAHQRASRTDIHALGLLDRLPIVRGGVQLLRRLKRRR